MKSTFAICFMAMCIAAVSAGTFCGINGCNTSGGGSGGAFCGPLGCSPPYQPGKIIQLFRPFHFLTVYSLSQVLGQAPVHDLAQAQARDQAVDQAVELMDAVSMAVDRLGTKVLALAVAQRGVDRFALTKTTAILMKHCHLSWRIDDNSIERQLQSKTLKFLDLSLTYNKKTFPSFNQRRFSYDFDTKLNLTKEKK
jgi:hypothetical protein